MAHTGTMHTTKKRRGEKRKKKDGEETRSPFTHTAITNAKKWGGGRKKKAFKKPTLPWQLKGLGKREGGKSSIPIVLSPVNVKDQDEEGKRGGTRGRKRAWKKGETRGEGGKKKSLYLLRCSRQRF